MSTTAPVPGMSGVLASAGSLYLRMRQDVLSGQFPAGTLLQETALTARYGVSRTPIRESLARLSHDGLLDRAARGYRVRAGTAEDVLDIYEARIALEAVAAGNAAARRTQLELTRLERLHDAADSCEDRDEERRLNAQWHEELWSAAHSTTIRDLLVRITAQLRIYDGSRQESAADLAETRVEHGLVMTALRLHDAAAAGEAVRRHLERSRDLRLESFARSAAG